MEEVAASQDVLVVFSLRIQSTREQAQACNTCRASDSATFFKISLSKANHVGKSKVKGWGSMVHAL